MNELAHESSTCRFDIFLPDGLCTNETKLKNDDHHNFSFSRSGSELKCIPESRIAQRLRKSLTVLKNSHSDSQSQIIINAHVDKQDGKSNNDSGCAGNSTDSVSAPNTPEPSDRSHHTNTDESANSEGILIVDEKSGHDNHDACEDDEKNGYTYDDMQSNKGNSKEKDSKKTDDETYNHKTKIDVVSVKKCEKVIVCFEALYRKYIDSANAIFEINISSNHREHLMQLFDHGYYRRVVMHQNSFDEQNIVLSSYKNNVVNMSLIKKELNDFVLMQKSASEFELIKMILKRIIENVEKGVFEVSSLMNDSFIRFKNLTSE